ncbi:hypothetical protein AMELA_G00262650 [Ameiurus melas]|uniref:Cortactin-binding protein-2 N-terminal domain-containing protein n=1 Tax=Ameiurus melas TaxID=219545 RepID=A0A7J5ZRY2_AMEME|nr:hypothetical protein AMELA_G00262650 [Ameiurus melas]
MKPSRMDVETLSKAELLMLLSILEGELEAQDLVIHTLKAQQRDAFVQERYGRYDLSDPFMALQRDSEAMQDHGQGQTQARGHGGRGQVNPSPLAVLKLVMGHCKHMQEKMMAQLAAAESRHRRVIADLEEEKRRHAQDTAEGDDVTYMLEKERERLLQQKPFSVASKIFARLFTKVGDGEGTGRASGARMSLAFSPGGGKPGTAAAALF